MIQENAVKKHWRYGGKITHIGVEVLPNGNNIDVEIDRIEFKTKVEINGQKQDKWICTFKDNPYFKLPMVLNTTNRKRICRLFDTSYPEDVKDFKITLTKEMANIPGEGIKDWALRVSTSKPKPMTHEMEVNNLIANMNKCKTIQELVDIWTGCKLQSDPKVSARKDELKKELGGNK